MMTFILTRAFFAPTILHRNEVQQGQFRLSQWLWRRCRGLTRQTFRVTCEVTSISGIPVLQGTYMCAPWWVQSSVLNEAVHKQVITILEIILFIKHYENTVYIECPPLDCQYYKHYKRKSRLFYDLTVRISIA